MLHALTREISPAIGRCELTHVQREPIDFGRACLEHAAYRGLLTELGCKVIVLPPVEELPDSVFVEDAAFVLDELAVLTRPGAESRRGETATISAALEPYRQVASIHAPGTLDGGDIVRIGKQVWVGMSQRSNQAGADQLARILKPHGYTVHTAVPRGCLHLKSAVTAVGPEHVVVNPEWVDPEAFSTYQVTTIDPSEPFGANTVLVGDVVVISASHPRTQARLEQAGFSCRSVESAELAKAEGGLTCCSILFEA